MAKYDRRMAHNLNARMLFSQSSEQPSSECSELTENICHGQLNSGAGARNAQAFVGFRQSAMAQREISHIWSVIDSGEKVTGCSCG